MNYRDTTNTWTYMNWDDIKNYLIKTHTNKIKIIFSNQHKRVVNEKVFILNLYFSCYTR